MEAAGELLFDALNCSIGVRMLDRQEEQIDKRRKKCSENIKRVTM